MRSDLPEFQPAHSSWSAGPVYPPGCLPEPGPRRREWIASGALLILTLLSTSFAGLSLFFNSDFIAAFHALAANPRLIFIGLPFSLPLVGILLAHELGHFLACRHYGMHCTPPYFMPFPISPIGTFGAFIKIKSQFRNRRALFDIGIAGPLAGFVFVLPALVIGIQLSHLVPKGELLSGNLSFGEPLIFRLLGHAILGYEPGRQDMIAHPMAMAAWVGLLATSLNLLPIWQLDGGHIAYAVFGRRAQKKISLAAIASLVLVSFTAWPPSYTLLFFMILILIVGARMRFFHPATLVEEEKIGAGRLVLGIVALLILILSFTPVPITIT